MLAARADLHPTAANLLVDAARQLHSGRGIFDLIGRRRMFAGYARLRRVERAMRARKAQAPADDPLDELDRIEESATGVNESVIKAGELYTFHVHVRAVRDPVLARVHSAQPDRASARSVTARGEAR